MSKKTIYIIIISLIVILGIGFWFFFYSNNSQTNPGEDNLSIRDFLPFGKAPETQNKPEETNNNNSNSNENFKISKLRKISKNPISGFKTFKSGQENFVRFVDRATGHIFEASTEFDGIQRLTNTTIPKVQEAIWANKDSVFMRYTRDDEETIETVLLRLLPPGTSDDLVFEFSKELKLEDVDQEVLNLQITLNKDESTQVSASGVGSSGNETNYFGSKTESAVKKFQEKYREELLTPQELTEASGIVDELTRNKLNDITGFNNKEEVAEEDSNLFETILTFLPTDIKQLTYLDKIQKVFFIQEDSLGSVGTLSNIDGSKKNQIFQSPAREWTSNSGDTVTLSTKASNFYPGVLYQLDQTGKTKKITGNYLGLTGSIDPSNKKLLYSQSRDRYVLKTLSLEGGGETDLYIQTLPEKCVWSKIERNIVYCAVPNSIPNEDYIDNWYQGVFSSEDEIWKLNTETRDVETISNLTQEIKIDAIDLSLSSDERFIFFTNKKDYSLWSFKIFDESIENTETNNTKEEVATTTEETI